MVPALRQRERRQPHVALVTLRWIDGGAVELLTEQHASDTVRRCEYFRAVLRVCANPGGTVVVVRA